MKTKFKDKYPKAWAWYSPSIGMGLWAVPYKTTLVHEGPMTEDSIAVQVKLVPTNKKIRNRKNLRGSNCSF